MKLIPKTNFVIRKTIVSDDIKIIKKIKKKKKKKINIVNLEKNNELYDIDYSKYIGIIPIFYHKNIYLPKNTNKLKYHTTFMLLKNLKFFDVIDKNDKKDKDNITNYLIEKYKIKNSNINHVELSTNIKGLNIYTVVLNNWKSICSKTHNDPGFRNNFCWLIDFYLFKFYENKPISIFKNMIANDSYHINNKKSLYPNFISDKYTDYNKLPSISFKLVFNCLSKIKEN